MTSTTTQLTLEVLLDPSQVTEDVKRLEKDLAAKTIRIPVTLSPTAKLEIEAAVRRALKTSLPTKKRATAANNIDYSRLKSVIVAALREAGFSGTTENNTNSGGFDAFSAIAGGISKVASITGAMISPLFKIMSSIGLIRTAVNESLHESLIDSAPFRQTVTEAINESSAGPNKEGGGGIIGKLITALVLLPSRFLDNVVSSIEGNIQAAFDRATQPLVKGVRVGLELIVEEILGEDIGKVVRGFRQHVEGVMYPLLEKLPPRLRGIFTEAFATSIDNLSGILMSRSELISELRTLRDKGFTDTRLTKSTSELRTEFNKASTRERTARENLRFNLESPDTAAPPAASRRPTNYFDTAAPPVAPRRPTNYLQEDIWNEDHLVDTEAEFEKQRKKLFDRLVSLSDTNLRSVSDYLGVVQQVGNTSADEAAQDVIAHYSKVGNLFPVEEIVSFIDDVPADIRREVVRLSNQPTKLDTELSKRLKRVQAELADALDVTTDRTLLDVSEAIDDGRKLAAALASSATDDDTREIIARYRKDLVKIKTQMEKEVYTSPNIPTTQRSPRSNLSSEGEPKISRLASTSLDTEERKFKNSGIPDLYQKIGDITADIAGVAASFKLPKINVDRNLPTGVRTAYVPEGNVLSISPEVKKLLDKGIINPNIVGDLIHEIRHAMQFDFGEIDIDDAIKKDLIIPTKKEIEKIGSAVSASVKASGATGDNIAKVRYLEADAYTFQLRSIEDVQKALSELEHGSAKGFNSIEEAMKAASNTARLYGSGLDSNVTSKLEAVGREVKSLDKSFEGLKGVKVFGTTVGGVLSSLQTFITGSLMSAAFFSLDEKLVSIATAVVDTYSEFEVLERRLQFGTDGGGVDALERLYESSQRLGISFRESAAGYASFSAAARGTSLQAVSSEVFDDINEAVAAMGMSADDTNGVFVALTQMTSKGVVSMEELRGQLAERLPQGFSATISAVNDMIEAGVLAPEKVNKSLLAASQEVKDSYRATSEDVNKFISSGLLSATEFLPFFTKRMKDGLEQPVNSYIQLVNRLENAWTQLLKNIGETAVGPLTDALSPLVLGTQLLEVLAKNTSILNAALTAVGTGSLSLIIAGIGLMLKSVGVLSISLKSLMAMSVGLKLVPIADVLRSIPAIIDLIQIKSLGLFKSISVFVAANPLGAALLAISLLSAALGPLGEFFINLFNGTSKKALKLGDDINEVSNAIDDLQRKFNSGDLVDVGDIERQKEELKTLFSGTDEELLNLRLQYKLNPEEARKNINDLGLEDRQIMDRFIIIDDFEGKNEQRIEQTKQLEEALRELNAQQQELNDSEKEGALIRQEALASGELSDVQDAKNNLESERRLAKERLELAQSTIATLDQMDSGYGSSEVIAKRNETRRDAEEQIYTERMLLAELTLKAREELVKEELDSIDQAAKKATAIQVEAEADRVDKVRKLNEGDSAGIATAEAERLALVEDGIEAELSLLLERKERVSALLKDSVSGSTEERDLTSELVTIEQARLGVISRSLEIEEQRQSELQRQVELQAEIIQGKVDELNTESELLAIASEISNKRAELSSAQNDLSTARLELEKAQLNSESARIEHAITGAEILREIEGDRRAEVAARLGLEANANPIELSRAREQQEQRVFALQRKQIELQQEAERRQLEADKSQLKFTIEQERYRLRAAQLENEIAKLKAQQAVSAAMALRASALAVGNSEAAAAAELQIAQSRRELQLLDNGLIQGQLQALGESERLQHEILEARGEALEVSHEQQDLELSLEQTSENRQRLLDGERDLIEQNIRARELERSATYKILELGSEETQQALELMKMRESLASLEEEHSDRLAYVRDLEAAGAQTSAERALLLEAQNDLQETGVNLLETEIEIERSLANEVSQARENALERQTRELERQVEILEQQESLITANAELQSAQSDLSIAQIEGGMVNTDRAEESGSISAAEADLERADLQAQILDREEEALRAQQDADRKRLEIEQQIEILRLKATRAEAEVNAARARQVEAEARTTLARAETDGDPDAIAAAQRGVAAASGGVGVADAQVANISEQIELAEQLQGMQLDTLATQHEADVQRLDNRREELQLTREIAQEALRTDQNTLSRGGGRASGGGVSAGVEYTVGERGVELFQGTDGSSQLVGLTGQHSFVPRVSGTIAPNQRLEQILAANVMHADDALIDAIQNGFYRSGSDFARLAGVLANRTAKPIVVHNHGNRDEGINWNNSRLSRL